MEKTKKQHYVPQFYLERFGDETQKNPKISVLKLQDDTILNNQNPINFANERYFYDTSRETLEEALRIDFKVFPELENNERLNDDQFVEHTLSRKEGAYAQMLRDIEANPQCIFDDQTRGIFICFVHELSYRSKKYRDKLDEINNKMKEFINEICEQNNLSDATRKATIKENCTSGIEIQTKEITSLGPILQTNKVLLENYDWYIAYNNTDLDFVISDDPLGWLKYGFNDICVPISKKLAIIMKVSKKNSPMLSHDIPQGNVIYLSEKSVIAYNYFQIVQAQMYLFGSEKSIEFMKQLHSKNNTTQKPYN